MAASKKIEFATKPTAVELAAQINALFGPGTVSLGSDKRFEVEYLPTGFLPLDILLGGGLAQGRMVEIFGTWSSLKSLIGLHAIATTQRAGKVAALIDTEHAYDPTWAEQLGVDRSKLLIDWPETGEKAVDLMEAFVRAKADLIVVDSVSVLLPRSEKELMMQEQAQPARLAALMSAALRKLTTANEKTAFLWINQTREKVGITFGNKETTTGGTSLPFYASQRVHMRKSSKVTEVIKAFDGDKDVDVKKLIGQKFVAGLEKSKLNTPHQEAHFTWDLKSASIDMASYLTAKALELGLVEKNAATWTYQGTKIVGREKWLTELAKNEDMKWELETEIRKAYKISPLPSRGPSRQDNNRGASQSGKKPVEGAPDSTPIPVQAESSTTPAPKTSSSRSRIRKSATP